MFEDLYEGYRKYKITLILPKMLKFKVPGDRWYGDFKYQNIYAKLIGIANEFRIDQMTEIIRGESVTVPKFYVDFYKLMDEDKPICIDYYCIQYKKEPAIKITKECLRDINLNIADAIGEIVFCKIVKIQNISKRGDYKVYMRGGD